MENNQFLIPLVVGVALDAVLGDPRWLPHPIRLFGTIIAWGEKTLNQGRRRFARGMAMTIVLVSGGWGITFSLLSVAPHQVVYYALASIGVFYCLAARSLIDECAKVMTILKHKSIEEARAQLSFIVGRETSALSEQQIRTAVLETLAENLSDGVIAPLFWYAVGGVPAMLAYKMVNTLDSMIGYKSVRYKQFGHFAARLDDVVNFVPARIAALLIALVSASPRSVAFIVRYGNKHASPNSGYPESAMAGALNCRFGGPNVYHGEVVEKPYIGNNQRLLTDKDFRKSVVIAVATCVCFVGAMLVL